MKNEEKLLSCILIRIKNEECMAWLGFASLRGRPYEENDEKSRKSDESQVHQ